ncbi:DUF6456 domain-containing protein [Paenochrobactrum sp. BZR 588]|uniref:DUF6456 domain-containing protein n=1 Tax=Paenochrobactrum TaxID=999488 RepID=UPI0035BBBC5D
MNVQHNAERNLAMIRVLKFLHKSPAKPEQAAARDMMLLNSEHGTISVTQDCLVTLAREGYLQAGKGEILSLSPQGIDYLVYQKNRHIAEVQLSDQGRAKKVKLNLAESPLAVLYRMKNAAKQSFLTDAEFNAGERLRSDFTRGLMMPRVTSHWNADVQTHSRGICHGGVELSDAAMAARIRVEKALDAVGPELSGALVDICCFLKTLGQVETERNWPARSAKMMIKTGLSILHRHYHPVAQRRSSSGVLHWGAYDYRPSL